MSRKERLLHRDSWWIKDFPDALEYVKMVLDSESPPDKEMNTTSGRRLLIGEYSILKKNGDEKNRKKLAEVTVKLLDNPDYSCDAIPVAAELGLPEAKEWFIQLSNRPLQEIRDIKTNEYSNGLYCLLNYMRDYNANDFISTITKIVNESRDRLEVLRAMSVLAEIKPELALEKISNHIPMLLETNSKQSKIISFTETTHGIFKKYGDGYCTDLAKRFKETLPKEYQLLFYKALEQNPTPRFKPYLSELKTILEIEE